MSLEEAILDKVRRLPPAKQEQVLRFADGLQQGPLVRKSPSRDRRREMDWIKQNRAEYVDQWVVVEGEHLVAADTDGHRAFSVAKAAGIDVPFLVHVLPEDLLPFLPGW
jgi:poly(3-hydroxybutyrate) depolymerase